MIQERREVPRFSVDLCVSRMDDQELFGRIKDFSRRGMRVILNTPDIGQRDEIKIRIQQPDYNELIPTVSSIAWKKCFEDKCEVGLKFKDFPVGAKADFLDYGYKKWLKGRLYS